MGANLGVEKSLDAARTSEYATLSSEDLMNREYHKWYSLSLGRDMELLLFGHAGRPVIVFPTSMGRFFDYENRNMIGIVGDQYERGLNSGFLRRFGGCGKPVQQGSSSCGACGSA